jgi:High-temperature-induced dauer-formation protein
LEAFSSVILHNLSDNPNLIYGILTVHKTFEDLGTFTLSRGLREIKRVQQAKEELARKTEGKSRDKSLTDETGEQEEPSDEKARLLESEHGGENDLATLEEGTRRPDNLDGTRNPNLSISEELSAEPTSEKARGKRRAQRSMSMDATGSLERIAAAGVGKNGFVPTQEWVCTLSIITGIKTNTYSRSLLGNKGKNWAVLLVVVSLNLFVDYPWML